MSVYSIIAATNGFTAVRSGRGNAGWVTQNAQYINTSLGPNGGSQWAIWSVHIPSANPNETLDAVRFRNGHDYTVAGGAGTRVATVGVAFNKSVNAFIDSSNAVAIGSRIGSGVGANVDVVVDASNFGTFTSNDLRAGSFFVGISAFANGLDPGWLSDVYRMGILTWDIYTQGTTPSPPVGDPSIQINNPVSNINPGKYAGLENFLSVKGIWVSNGLPARNFLTFTWTITPPPGGGGVTFSNGTQTLTAQKGWYYGPTNWDNHDTGPINISNTAVPGIYTLTLVIQSGDGDGRYVYGTTQLVVMFPNNMTTEF